MTKKYILFSPVGDHDPISPKDNTEGAMLHILRHEKNIEAVVLFLTKEMQDKASKDNRYELAIKKIKSAIEIQVIKDGIKEANDFNFYIEEFGKILRNIHDTYSGDHEILLNVSSGTPQMKAALVFLKCSSDLPLKIIQVDTPNKKSNTEDNFKIEMLGSIKETENRCHKPNIVNYYKTYFVKQIEFLLKKYEYGAIEELVEKTNYFENKEQILSKIQEALSIINSKESDIVNYFWVMNLNQKRGQLNYMVLMIEPIMTNILYKVLEDKIKDFIVNDRIDGSKLKIKDKNLHEKLKTCLNGYVNFVNLLEIYKHYYSNGDVIKILGEIFEVKKGRNELAHKLSFTTEEKLKEFGGSAEILKKIGGLITNLVEPINIKDFIFDKINSEIIKILE